MTQYAVYFDDRATEEAERYYFNLSARRGHDDAKDWYNELFAEAKRALREMPRRFALSEDGCLAYPGTLVRQMRYGSGRNSFRILFHVVEPDEDEEEGVVVILRVRHSAMRPLTNEAADDNEA